MPPKKAAKKAAAKQKEKVVKQTRATSQTKAAAKPKAEVKTNKRKASQVVATTTVVTATAAKKVKRGDSKKNLAATAASTTTQVVAKTAVTNTATTSTQQVNLTLKGGVPVDQFVPNKDTFHVFQKGGKAYTATLNQSKLDTNNNKFYIIQILQKDNNATQFWVWNRWGRVGVPGQNALKGPMGEYAAIADYEAKHRDKTVKGDYVELQIKFDDVVPTSTAVKKTTSKGKLPKRTKTVSYLPPPVQDFIKLIFDLKIMNLAMTKIGYDPKKCPLGKLGDQTIRQGYAVLNSLFNAVRGRQARDQISKLSGDFYTLIPHDFGFQKMSNFILDTEQKIQEKLNMLAQLSDMKIAAQFIEGQDHNSNVDIIDQNYQKLRCKIENLPHSHPESKIILEYIENTKGSVKVQVFDIFKVDREGESQRYRKDIGNEYLLWHGSRLTNFVGILSQGLRIAPPEAPASGYAFGKGLYFADMFEKSAHYCRAFGSEYACIILVQVAVGTPNIVKQWGCGKQLPAKTHSLKYFTGSEPPVEKHIEGVKVPCGKPKQVNGHNEIIVYDETQAKMKYIIKMKLQ